MNGQIGVPIKLVATQAGQWVQTHGVSVILRVALDNKSASFTPSENGSYRFLCGTQQFVVQVGEEVPPIPEPTPTPAGLIYDSNVNIDWNAISGTELKVTDSYGSIKANGKGFHMNASGSPRMYLKKATKELWLEHDGKYGRAYFCVTNYNARLECDFMLDSCSNNASFKIRNRHQVNEEGGYSVTDEHRQGGIGASAHCDEIGNGVEVVHGTNILDKSKSIKLEANKWYTIKFSVKDKDATTLTETTEIVGVGTAQYDIQPPKQFFYKADFDTWSEFWIRLNADSGGVLKLKNIKMFAI